MTREVARLQQTTIAEDAEVPAPAPAYTMSLNAKGFHRIAYRCHGSAGDAAPVLCVHGLTRHGGDFAPLAAALSASRRAICPDLAGRGDSDWLPDPSGYHVRQYNCDLAAVLAATKSTSVDFVGTSLGGLCGIVLAGIANTPVRRLVINDIAPQIPLPALRRVASYLSQNLSFPDLQAAEAHLRQIYSGFGPMTNADWHRMSQDSTRLGPNGEFRQHFDPAIGDNFRYYWLLHGFNLWSYWERIKCPILILRGTRSDFLTPPLLERMLRIQRNAEVVEFEGIGHTPTLNDAEQIDVVARWLQGSRRPEVRAARPRQR